MKLDGRALAQEILDKLRIEVHVLKKKGVKPHLVVILFGNNSNSISYIKQKQKGAQRIGATLTFVHEPSVPTQEEAEKIVKKYAHDRSVHALIIQRPIPHPLDTDKLTSLNVLEKDVDGFLLHSPFAAPVGLAVVKILQRIYSFDGNKNLDFSNWANSKNTLLVGRGETGGKPIGETLTKFGIKFIPMHSQTPDKEKLFQSSDVIVTAVGKSGTIPIHFLKKGVVLIGVGLHEENGKLIGDYNDEEVEKLASFYSPTPGGTGPVNVACLMENLVTAAKQARG